MEPIYVMEDDFTSGPRVEGRGTLVETLPLGPQTEEHYLIDIEYFRKKAEQSFHVEMRNRAKEQLALLEDALVIYRSTQPARN